MKKLLLGLSTIGALAPIASVVACATEVVVVQKKAELGVMVSDPENQRWVKAKNLFQQSSEKTELKTEVAIKKTAAEQAEWIKKRLPSLKALIVGASNDSVADSWADWDNSNTKPVIAYDRLIKTENRKAYNWYVTFDNEAVGAMQGKDIVVSIYAHGDKSIADRLKNMTSDQLVEYAKDNNLAEDRIVATLAGDPADNNAHLFFEGAMNLLNNIKANDSHFILKDPFEQFQKVAQDGWDYAKGEEFLIKYIGELPQTDQDHLAAVLAPNDLMADSAIKSLTTLSIDPSKVYITGQDAINVGILAIEDHHKQDMSIYKSDADATSVAAGLAKFLINHPEDNVDPSKMSEEEFDKIKASIVATFGPIKMEWDHMMYETSINHPINTILLTPEEVNPDNVEKLFPEID